VAVAACADFFVWSAIMSDSATVLIVLVTAPSRKEAEQIGQAAVRKKLAACTTIIPSVTSIFRWKGKVEKSRETLLILKTTQRRYAELAKMVRSMHSYEVPEVIALNITQGLPRYIAWVKHETATD
jgi:periplasmic divalent cation tolerance protein